MAKPEAIFRKRIHNQVKETTNVFKLKFTPLPAIALPLLLAFGAGSHAGDGPAGADDTSSPPMKGGDTSNVACYFDMRDGNIKWKWALREDDSWFGMRGEWKTTKYTKIQKFFADIGEGEMAAACGHAKRYYELDGELMAFFAATSSMGSNYPIVTGGRELYPNF